MRISTTRCSYGHRGRTTLFWPDNQIMSEKPPRGRRLPFRASLLAALALVAALLFVRVGVAQVPSAGEPPPTRQARGFGEEYREHREAIWIIACALLLQSAAITLLVKSASRRRQADLLLSESEERFRMLAERSQTGIYVMDRDETILYVNRSFAEIFGYGRDEIIGTSFRSLVCRQDLPGVADTFRNQITGTMAPSHHEVRGERRDGGLIDIELFAALNSTSGKPSIIGTVLDITARKSDERTMQRHQSDLEQMNRTLEQRIAAEVENSREMDRLMMQQSRFAAMGEMIGNIAHQWRQPLNMLGMVIQQMQMEQEKGQLTSEVMEQRAAKGMELLLYLSRTIDDFRNFFRPDVEPRPFSLTTAVTKTVDFFEPSCSEHGITVTLEGNSTLRYTGHVNEFSQALLNILNNARDALVEGHAARPGIVVALHDEGERGVVTVRDNGGGIAPAVIDKIFDPYFTTKEEGKGTGVGLYMARTIIERHMQGSIRARNLADGAEFKVTL